ncbi:membrane protein YdbS with pleckstrin-like domain [Catenuloplanes nepalensis]|uniref:Membrane protein YdbS with pleckstrin-like domain n=1 Tax=Catenuloplanes nepalensis TaxID=587533 RepID=A0ABT9MVB4_9ACTN|nr:hypothetical protein [Catenuloplanes nepalensis]MDP9795319.1 membrane protein YdbS with pleckstrin-like domain [Catenuloplanes nepalensis]
MTAPLRRPDGVTGAAYLFSGAAAVWASAAFASFFAVPQYQRHYGDLRESADAALIAGLLLGAGGVVALVVAGLAVLLALLDLSGRPGARTITYLLGALAFVFCVVVVAFDVFAAVPWHRWLMIGAALLTAGLVIAAGVLLALPSSRGWFRLAAQQRAVRAAQARLARQQPIYPFYPPMRPPGAP